MNSYQIKHIHLDFKEHKICAQDMEINVDQKAFEVLKIMIENANKVVTTETFMHQVWAEKPSSIEVVPAAISRLRKLLKMAGIHDELIVTVHKVGYKFVPLQQEKQIEITKEQQDTQLKRWKVFSISCFLLMLSFAYILLNNRFSSQQFSNNQPEPINLVSEAVSRHTQIYILRHTEKVDNSKDSALSPTGIKRAAYWRNVLKYVEFDMVFTTDFKRNRETAAIISQEFNVKPELYHPMSFDVVDFIAQVKGKTILIIGHSNTIPDMANRLLGESKYPPMNHKDYNQLITITINDNGHTSSSLLHIEVP